MRKPILPFLYTYYLSRNLFIIYLSLDVLTDCIFPFQGKSLLMCIPSPLPVSIMLIKIGLKGLVFPAIMPAACTPILMATLPPLVQCQLHHLQHIPHLQQKGIRQLSKRTLADMEVLREVRPVQLCLPALFPQIQQAF